MTSGIIEILTENTGVQNLVGRNKANTKYKVFPVVAEQDEDQPYITVYKPQNDPVTSLTKETASEMDHPRAVIACWAKNFRATELLFEAVREALDNQGFTTDVGYVFKRIWLVDDREGFEEPTRLYVHVATFGCQMGEPIDDEIPAESWPAIDNINVASADDNGVLVQLIAESTWTAPASLGMTLVFLAAPFQNDQTQPSESAFVEMGSVSADAMTMSEFYNDEYVAEFGTPAAGQFIPYMFKFVDQWDREEIVNTGFSEVGAA